MTYYISFLFQIISLFLLLIFFYLSGNIDEGLNIRRDRKFMNKRLQEFDLLRVATALAVIAIHITAGYIFTLPLAYYWNHMVRFAVPLFIVMSGFLLCHADLGAKALPTSVFYRKRLNRVLLPYILWTCFYSSLNAYLSGLGNLTIFLTTLSKNLLWGTGYYHLYFIPIIVQLYLLYPLLRKWLEKDARSLFGFSLTVTLAGQMILYLYLLHVISLPSQYGSIYVLAFPIWLFYFVFGMFVAKKQRDGSFASFFPGSGEGGKKTIPLLIWVICLGLVLLDSKLTASQGSIVRPSIMLYTISCFFFFYALAMQFRQGERSWLTWLSAQSFLIYLMHPFMLTVLTISAGKLGHPGLWAGNRGLLGLYVFTAAFTILGTYIVSRTPLAQLLGGVKQ